MKKLLLITGDLATGKSTFANILSERYSTIVLCKDSIKEILGDNIGFADRKENLRLSRATMELMTFVFAQSGKFGGDMILEANFRKAELDKLHRLASEYGYEQLSLVLQGSADILHKRYLNRILYEDRHPVHVSTGLDEFADFKDYIENLRSTDIPGQVININADDFFYQSDTALLSKIDKFMED